MDDKKILNQVYSVCSKLFGKYDNKDLLEHILNLAIELTKADRGSIFLAKKAQGKTLLQSTLATGYEGKPIQVELGQGVAGRVFLTKESLVVNDTSKNESFYSKIDEITGYKTRSLATVPLFDFSGESIGVVELLSSEVNKFNVESLELLQVFALFAGTVINGLNIQKDLHSSKKQLIQMNQESLKAAHSIKLSSKNSELNEVFKKLKYYAESESHVLVIGESGSGKEGLTQLMHLNSDRKNEAFIPINCAAIPEALFEAELFGVAKGAATGTIERKGKIELANHGTLFLDEVGELSLANQAKLLRVLQDKQVSPVGSENAPIDVDFRLICATNRDLLAEVKDGNFREDLYYRLNVIQIKLPPLRERIEDIPDLVASLLEQFKLKNQKWAHKSFSDEAIEKLKNYTWPGNIRELQNKMEIALIASGKETIVHRSHLNIESSAQKIDLKTIQEVSGSQFSEKDIVDLKSAKNHFEKQYIEKVLKVCQGNKTETAKKLGLSREGLRKALLKKAS